MVKNLPANAGDTGSVLGPGRFHRPRGHQAHEPQLLSPHPRGRALQQRSHCSEKPATVIEKPCAAVQTQYSQQ